MVDLLDFVARYELGLYAAFGLLSAAGLAFFWLAGARLDRTPFGLEKAAARRRQNAALAVLLLGAMGVGAVFSLNRYITPQLAGVVVAVASDPRATALPSPTPVLAAGPLVVDSSGCRNPDITLTEPAAGARLNGKVEVRGTATLANFAFYKIEISGAATSGAWFTLAVGNAPRLNDLLGSFETTPYPAGDYAFRLVVVDNVGLAAPPCVIAVSFASAATPGP